MDDARLVLDLVAGLASDVEERELRDPGPEVWHDDADANQPLAGERTERDPAVVDVALEGVHLALDGVLTVTSGSQAAALQSPCRTTSWPPCCS